MYDPELPNGFQDADFEMRELTAQANREARLRKRGICTHSWMHAPDVGPATCHHCGKVWPSSAEAWAEREQILL